MSVLPSLLICLMTLPATPATRRARRPPQRPAIRCPPRHHLRHSGPDIPWEGEQRQQDGNTLTVDDSFYAAPSTPSAPPITRDEPPAHQRSATQPPSRHSSTRKHPVKYSPPPPRHVGRPLSTTSSNGDRPWAASSAPALSSPRPRSSAPLARSLFSCAATPLMGTARPTLAQQLAITDTTDAALVAATAPEASQASICHHAPARPPRTRDPPTSTRAIIDGLRCAAMTGADLSLISADFIRRSRISHHWRLVCTRTVAQDVLLPPHNTWSSSPAERGLPQRLSYRARRRLPHRRRLEPLGLSVPTHASAGSRRKKPGRHAHTLDCRMAPGQKQIIHPAYIEALRIVPAPVVPQPPQDPAAYEQVDGGGANSCTNSATASMTAARRSRPPAYLEPAWTPATPPRAHFHAPAPPLSGHAPGGNLNAKGIAEPSTGCLRAPAVMVRKASGAWRLCCDYRAITKHVRIPQQPLPRTDDILASFNGKRYFSVLNMCQGFYRSRLPKKTARRPASSPPTASDSIAVSPLVLPPAQPINERPTSC
ncbi:hypothetical protein ACSSS7_006759 [Eimeria intestinalis]